MTTTESHQSEDTDIAPDPRGDAHSVPRHHERSFNPLVPRRFKYPVIAAFLALGAPTSAIAIRFLFRDSGEDWFLNEWNEHSFFYMFMFFGTAIVFSVQGWLIGRRTDQIAALGSAAENRSLHDPLTGLANRRYLDERLQETVEQATHRGHTMACLMIDIDHFKKLNDRYGHLVGDRVLRDLVHRMLDVRRAGDTIGRFGGEEFLVILPDTSQEEASSIAGRYHQAVRQMPFRINGRRVLVTISIGVAVCGPDGQTPADLVDAADRALYAAKSGGRDQVVVFSGPIPTGSAEADNS